MIAENDQIWNLINSNLKIKSENLSKFETFVYSKSKGANMNLKAYSIWKTEMSLHRIDLIDYEKQKESMKQLIKQIQFSISVNVVVLIANESSHSYNLLRALKLRFAFFDQTKKIQIETKYHDFCKKSKNQNLKKWLNEWRETYITSKAIGVSEMINERSIRDFIYNLMNQNEIWTNAHLVIINHTIEKNSFFDFISEFRNHTRMKSNKKLHQSAHSTFSASSQPNQTNQQTTDRSDQINQN